MRIENLRIILKQFFGNLSRLYRANLLDQVKALDMTAYLQKEKEYVPWITAISSLGYIGNMLEGSDDKGAYELYEVRYFSFCSLMRI